MSNTGLLLGTAAEAWALGVATRSLPALLVWCLPIVAYAALSPALPRLRRCLIPAAWLCSAYCAHLLGVSGLQLLTNLEGLVYYALVALLASPAASALSRRKTSRAGLFVAGLVACLLLPASILPGVAEAPVLALGWEMTFSFYSFCVEVADGRRNAAETPGWRGALFFLVVDPVLAFPERSRPGATSCFVALKRCAAGVASVVLSALLASPLTYTLAVSAGARWSPLLPALSAAVMRCLVAYWAQLGLINVRTGLLHAAGHHSPKCFMNPLVASDPLDFWRRWNVYLGTWLKRYVFVPLVARVRLRCAPWLRRGLFVFATLLACGLLHDTFGSARRLELNLNFTLQFVLIGTATLLWMTVDNAVGVALGRARLPRFERVTRRLVARFALVLGMLFLPFVWGNPS